jgi:hypothetical protein
MLCGRVNTFKTPNTTYFGVFGPKTGYQGLDDPKHKNIIELQSSANTIYISSDGGFLLYK